MTYDDFKTNFSQLPENYKAKDIQPLIKKLILQKEDVSCLKDHLVEHPEYYQPYFEICLSCIPSIDEKLKFVEEHFCLFTEWWHADMLFRILGVKLDFDTAFIKAVVYVKSENFVVRRWGYIMFIPRLTKDKSKIQDLLSLMHNDNNEYVITAEASLIAFLAITDPEIILQYFSECDLDRVIWLKAIEKISSSRQIQDEYKQRFKMLKNTLR